MGCLFGARLAPHADVTLVGRWPEQLEALRRAPLHFAAADGHEELVRLRATDDLAAAGTVDVALIMTKATKTGAAAEGAAQVLSPGGLAITVQNGLGNLKAIAPVVGAERATLGVTMQGAALLAPGVLHYGGPGPTYLATRPDIDERVQAVAVLFQQAGMETHVTADVTALVWEKLAINAAINPLTALLRTPNGALVDSEWARRIMGEAANEVAAVAAAQGINLSFANAAAQAEQVARRTAHNRSSMLQDVLRGAPTEIDAICGAVVRAGEDMGVPTPANRILYALVRAVEESYAIPRVSG